MRLKCFLICMLSLILIFSIIPLSEGKTNLAKKTAIKTAALKLSPLAPQASLNCGNYTYSSPIDAKASSIESGQYPAIKAIDGKETTHWKGDAKEQMPHWIYFDLGEKRCIKQLDLYIYRTYGPITMDIQISDDAKSWKTLLSKVQVPGGNNTKYSFAETSARFIRLYQTESPRNFGSLSEIKVLNAPLLNKGIITITPGTIRGTTPTAEPRKIINSTIGVDPRRFAKYAAYAVLYESQ